ncbi:MAG: NUDIX domain-containing protein [Oscillospiraceae bacterium]|nr:NUDIX domain-containing protein [Oscillospiraceae bacterium]
MEMNYCMRCGARLTYKEHPTDGAVPYCESCGDYRFPVFSTAVSILVMNPERTHVLLITQYGKPHFILPAGYVDKGENAEHAVRRELNEELGMIPLSVRYLCSHYYEPSETLMLNFAVTVEETEPQPNWEVDSWRWFPLDEARKTVRPGGLASRLLADWKE